MKEMPGQTNAMRIKDLTFKPLVKDTWKDLEALFGERGACGGCWCMHWRLRAKAYEQQKGEGNKAHLQQLVAADQPLGVIAYAQGKPIGWCSVSPREQLVRLENSRLFRRLDDRPVWSITCLFIDRAFRGQGISSSLISAAADLAFARGAGIVEAYPIIPGTSKVPAVFAWVGFLGAFLSAGFREETRPSESRAIVRKYVYGKQQ